MKIEKISDTQIKFLLNQSDLKERNIKLNELAYGSEKTQALFREMMEQAVSSCGFTIENSPLMIEAIPISSDSIMIIVSKVNEQIDIENKFNLSPPSKDSRKFKKKPILKENTETTADSENILIFSFKSLDDVTNAALRLKDIYNGTNLLYKNDDMYFLILQNDNSSDDIQTDSIEIILNEYGQKHISTLISKYYLLEHGEMLIKNDALNILSSYLV